MEKLKKRPLWLLWRKRTRNGKVAKIPFAADGSACGTNDEYESAWVAFEAAQKAAVKQKADGVGFVIPKGMFFLDIDHRDLDDPEVQKILALFNSYSEFSVSGAGIHIYGLCNVDQLPTWVDPKDGKRKLAKEYYTHHPENGLEVYFGDLTSRFAVFTGKTIKNLPLQDCTEALNKTLDRYMKRSTAESTLEQKAEKVIQELRSQKNGVKFSRIFDDGQWEEYLQKIDRIGLGVCGIHKGQQPFEYVYNGLLWFCTNRLPRFSADQGAWVYSRILPVVCPNMIPPEQQDKRLLDKMYAEREGIVQKCVKALQTVIANGYTFDEPESVIAARRQYQATNSTVISFFAECMCPWPEGKIGGSCVTTGAIHKAYLQWCKANNNGYARSSKEFRNELAMHLGTTFAEMTTRRHGNTYYKEWTLTTDAYDDYKHLL